MIGIGGLLHLMSCWVHTQVTKNCFVIVWLLGTKLGIITSEKYAESIRRKREMGSVVGRIFEKVGFKPKVEK